MSDPIAVADAMVIAFKRLAQYTPEYVCPQCDRRFPNYLSLANHHWSIHGEGAKV